MYMCPVVLQGTLCSFTRLCLRASAPVPASVRPKAYLLAETLYNIMQPALLRIKLPSEQFYRSGCCNKRANGRECSRLSRLPLASAKPGNIRCRLWSRTGTYSNDAEGCKEPADRLIHRGKHVRMLAGCGFQGNQLPVFTGSGFVRMSNRQKLHVPSKREASTVYSGCRGWPWA